MKSSVACGPLPTRAPPTTTQNHRPTRPDRRKLSSRPRAPTVTHSLPVIGAIPRAINGVYARNGANPMFNPTAGHHLFDGDGMVHAVKFDDGTTFYACRFTQIERLVQERQIGKPVFPKAIGQLHSHSGIARLLLFYTRSLLGLLDHCRCAAVANAGLVYFNRNKPESAAGQSRRQVVVPEMNMEVGMVNRGAEK